MRDLFRALVCVVTVLAVPAIAEEPAPHVLMISIDGLMPSTYTDADALDLKVPTLRRLVREGTYARGVIGVMPTVTFPSHTTLITGVPPRVHGITSNTVFDPEGLSANAYNWYASDIHAPTLISAAKARWLSTASVSWPVSIGIGADMMMPEIWRGTSKHAIDLKLLDAVSTPHLLESVAKWRGKPFPYPLTDEERTDVALFILKTYQPSLMLVHLLEVDFAEHGFGPGSPEAHGAIEATDERLGRLLQALRDLQLDKQTLVAVVSDHGFLPVTTELRPNTVLKQAGLLETEGGAVKTWQAVFHASGGSAALHLKNPTDRALVEKVRALFTPRLSEPSSGLRAILGADRIAALGGSAEYPLVLDAKDGFVFENAATGEWSAPTVLRGTHGHSPEREALNASLLFFGPALRAHTDLGIVKMTAIAPTLAKFLGVTLGPEADAPLVLAATQHPSLE